MLNSNPIWRNTVILNYNPIWRNTVMFNYNPIWRNTVILNSDFYCNRYCRFSSSKSHGVQLQEIVSRDCRPYIPGPHMNRPNCFANYGYLLFRIYFSLFIRGPGNVVFYPSFKRGRKSRSTVPLKRRLTSSTLSNKALMKTYKFIRK